MRSLRSVVIVLGWIVASAVAHADMMVRLRLENLRAVHEEVETLKTQRREVMLKSGYDDVRAVLHAHSHLSHDSRGTIEEIVAAAKEASVRVILFSEHPANHYDYFLDGHRGEVDGVLLIPGAETGGFLAYPRRSIQRDTTDSPQAFADLVRSTGGMLFLCHLEERMDWQIANLTGTEIYNTHADVKDEAGFNAAIRSPLSLFGLSAALKQYPQETFGALLDYPADYLRRYDELCQISPHTGVAGNDSHHNVVYRARILEDGKVLLEDALDTKIALVDPEKLPPIKLLTAGKKPGDVIFELDMDPYVRSFRHVSTHLLVYEVTEAGVRGALAAGRAYVAFDWLANPTDFVFQAALGERAFPMGSEVPLTPNLRLRAEAPLIGRFKLVRNGKIVRNQTGRRLDFEVDSPGVYRVEVWLEIAREERPWILTNPVYVRSIE